MQDDLRVALIGYGHAGAVFHGPLLAATAGARLAAIVTADPVRRAQAAAAHPGARLLPDAEALWRMAADLEELPAPAADPEAEASVQGTVSSLLSGTDGERPAVIRTELQEVMFSKCGVYRTEVLLTDARDAVASLKARARTLRVDDRGCRYNTDLTDALELGFLLDTAEATVASALARTESRGGHARGPCMRRRWSWLAFGAGHYSPLQSS
jgi:succinate dehydrogenase/fumarate reductase flavoprotein subunit